MNLQNNIEFPPNGLPNPTKTRCYFNSVLQCLSRTPYIHDILETAEIRNQLRYEHENEDVRCITGSFTSSLGSTLMSLVTHLYYKSYSFTDTYTHFVEKEPNFNNCEHHDCHDCLKAIIRVVNEEQFANIEIIFKGMLRNKRQCLSCNAVTVSDEDFEDISLCIINNRGCSIEDCLNSYMAEEILSDPVTCDACTAESEYGKPVKTYAKLQQSIVMLPEVLVLNMKRYSFTDGYLSKNSAPVKFSELLDLRPYCSIQNILDKNVLYSLYAIIVHSGVINRGHYIAYVKVNHSKILKHLRKTLIYKNFNTSLTLLEQSHIVNKKPREESWYIVNDSIVEECSLKDVLGVEPTMLFYKKLNVRKLYCR